MKVLGRRLVPPFDEFWDRFSTEIDVSTHLIEEGHRSVFGTEAHEPGSSRLPRWMDLPDEALSYHVAHELTHVVMRVRGFPATSRGRHYGEESAEARVGGDLEEMVGHPALEELLRPFPFDRDHIRRHLFEGALKGIEGSPVPVPGTPWWATWACRFCELHFLLPQTQWLRLEVVYDGRCPDIAVKGRELVDIMLRAGSGTPGQALEAMINARDALALKDADRCLVIDRRDGTVH